MNLTQKTKKSKTINFWRVLDLAKTNKLAEQWVSLIQKGDVNETDSEMVKLFAEFEDAYNKHPGEHCGC